MSFSSYCFVNDTISSNSFKDFQLTLSHNVESSAYQVFISATGYNFSTTTPENIVSLGIVATIKELDLVMIGVYTAEAPIYVTTVHFNLVVYSSIYYVK